MHDIKIAYIGGGSRGWAQRLMIDLALAEGLTGELALYDIDRKAAAANVVIGTDLFRHKQAKSHFRVTQAKTSRAALSGADFVVMSIEPGPTEMRFADLEIPAKYGIYQPVGDSTGPGGILRALRAIPVYADYAREIVDVCPQAWVINYTNPMTLCTSALYAAAPQIKAFGCCHEVFGTQAHLAKLVAKWFKIKEPCRDDIHLDIAGINHFTFATAAHWDGHDLWPLLQKEIAKPGCFRDRTAAAEERKAKEHWFTCDGLVAYDLFRRFGALGVAGDRHLAEFVPWYLSGGETSAHRWGFVLTPYSWRLARMQKLPAKQYGEDLGSSGEEGVVQIKALLGDTALYTNVNVPNRGQIPDLPPGAVVETYSYLRRDSLTPVVARPLPAGAQALVTRIVSVQQMVLEAALTGNRELAFAALLCDPLVSIPTDRARAMFDEMLAYASKQLPPAFRRS